MNTLGMRTRGMLLAAAIMSGSLLSIVSRVEAYTISSFGPEFWGASDTTLGIAGFQIEDFEDTNLLPNLRVEINNLGTKNVLDNTFDPLTDPFGNAFVGGNWDGSNVLLNTTDNLSRPYGDASGWEVITFHIAGGATAVGFGMKQVQTDVMLVVNGQPLGGLLSIGGLTQGSDRNGYLIVSTDTGDALITSVSIDNTLSGSSGDGYSFDHLSFTVPIPASIVMFVSGIGLLFSLMRRKSA